MLAGRVACRRVGCWLHGAGKSEEQEKEEEEEEEEEVEERVVEY